MKKNLWIWALAAFSMAACTSDETPAPQVTENDWISPDGRVVVQLSADGLPTPSVSVGGRAAITGTEITALDNLGIFALDRAGGYDAADNNQILLGNVPAKGTADNTLDGDVHTTTEGTALKRISLYTEENQTNASIYYYPIKPENNYDFYGYYPRQTDVQYENDEVTVTFAETDGSTDIITGKAEAASQIEPGTLFVDEQGTTNADAWDGYNSRYIRTIKYHNWLIDEGKQEGEKQRFVPNIKFQHRAALLQFFVVANDKQAGDENPPYDDQLATTKLRVQDVILNDVNTVATWKVVSDELTWGTPVKDLPVLQSNAEDNTVWEDETIIPAADKDAAKQAGYMLVEPRGGYTITLTVVVPDTGAGNVIPQTQTTTLTIGTTFEAGHRYNVYIQLNALQEVMIDAELVDWKNGADVDIPVE